MFYAHTNGEDISHWQPLKNHLENVASIAGDLGEKIGLADHARLIALLHDIGKYSLAFQKRLLGSIRRVDHSTAGAFEIKTHVKPPLLSTLLAFCVLGHHGGLPNYGSPIDDSSDSSLCARLKRKLEDFSSYKHDFEFIDMRLPKMNIQPITKSGGFSTSLIVRMLYSILVDADFLDTETFMNQGKKPRGEYESINALTLRFNDFLKRFYQPQTKIHAYRTEILHQCLNKSKQKPSLFNLTVPTGGGKTYSSMAFALNHAISNHLDRIIYVIPFTSIIEQNAALFKDALGKQNVLEHHSNFDWNPEHKQSQLVGYEDGDENIIQKLKLASENYDIPVVVTTNVQFFESLFSNLPSRARKIHNMARSVIIFDEAQMIPRDFIKPCLYAVIELVTNYECSAVLCTATQPVIDILLPNRSTQPEEIAKNPKELYERFQRVKIESLNTITDNQLINTLNGHDQVICIVNTRRHAREIFSGIQPNNSFHLSTLMCAAHRSVTLLKIRNHLDKGEPCRLVSTQLVEAGVDIDFPIGYRALAGLDSIIQAAGRVNRNMKSEKGTLFVFEPQSPAIRRIPAFIQQGADVARQILREFEKDPISSEAIKEYYRRMYQFQDEQSFDRQDILGCFEKMGIRDADFDFKTAAEKFRLIADPTVSIVIKFDDQAERLLKEVIQTTNPGMFIRQLQPYTVNIYEKEFNSLLNLGKIDIYHDTFSVLNDMQDYNDETGLRIPEEDTVKGEAVFF